MAETGEGKDSGYQVINILAIGVALLWWGWVIQLYFAKKYRFFLADFPVSSGVQPKVSLILTAQNDEKYIGATVTRLLGLQYPNFEIIVVNDRSTDGTLGILEAMRSADSRLQVKTVATLPEGWLGKCHAMKQGEEAATGDFLAFIDSDILLEPLSLSKVMGWVQREKLDHVSALAEMACPTPLIRMIGAAYLVINYAFFSLWKVNDDRSPSFYGFGFFNFFRREALEKIGGIQSVKMEVHEDMGLAALVRKSGGKQRMFFSDGEMRFQWIARPWDVVRVIEKNAISALGYQPWKAILVSLLIGFISLSPYAFALNWARPVSAGAGLAALVAIFLTYGLVGSRWFGKISAIGFPLGVLLTAMGVVNSAIQFTRRRGILWRGTFYPAEAVRRGMVYKR